MLNLISSKTYLPTTVPKKKNKFLRLFCLCCDYGLYLFNNLNKFNMSTAKQITVQIVNAFVDHDLGGNPAGVVLHADNLTTAEKQKLAAQVGLSEIAFVSSSKQAAFKLDFFTPNRQIAHCGHATIATFSYLSQLGQIPDPHSSKETIDGTREIILQGDLAFMEQKTPKYFPIDQQKVLQSLHLSENDLIDKQGISIVNTGNSFAIIPVASQDVLRALQPDFDLIQAISEEYDLIGYYLFCTQPSTTERDVSTRMFAPRYGIQEEAGTGMAAGPLAAYLYDKMGIKKDQFLIEQGWFMENPSPSLIQVELTIGDGSITKIMAGGKGIAMRSVIVEIAQA